MAERVAQMLLELWKLGAVPTAPRSLFHAHCLLKNLFLTLSLTLPTQLHDVPSGQHDGRRHRRSQALSLPAPFLLIARRTQVNAPET